MRRRGLLLNSAKLDHSAVARKSKKEKEKEKAKKERPKTGGPGSKLFEEVSYNGSTNTNRSNTPGKLSVSSMLESCPSDVIPVIEEKSLPEEKPKVVWKMGTSSSNFYSVLGDGAAQLMVQLREGGGGGKAGGNRKRTGTAAFFEELKEGAEKLSTQAELLRPNQKLTLSKARESLTSSISSSAVEPVSTPPQTPGRSKREKSLSSSACEQRASRRASKRDKKRSNSGGSISSRISSKINNSEKKGKEKEVSQRGPDKEEAESELREEEKEKEEHQPSSLYDASLPSPAADDSLLLLSTVSRTEESVVSGFSVDRSAAVVTEQMTGDMAAREEEQEHPYAQQQAGEDPTSTTEQQS